MSDPLSPTEITAEVLRELPLPQYSDDSSKADYGKLLIIAGSRRLPGAAILAARAALRAGCGTVRVAAPKSVATHIGVQVPELMIIPLPETASGTIALNASTLLAEQYEPCDAVVIGPGLDEDEETRVLLRRLALEMPLPAVLDAAALLALGEAKPTYLCPRILTPHWGEFETMQGPVNEPLSLSRDELTSAFARQSGDKVILVLKGRETLIATEPDGLFRNTAGTRGLGTAGSGDVLAGIIGSLLTQFVAQKMEGSVLRAAVWGVHLHALCGEAAEKDMGDDGLMASDLIARLPGVLRYLRKQTEPKKDAHLGLRPQ
jgi:hydroxyethylthiazole kinase-like uncharacterized protein yjeF